MSISLSSGLLGWPMPQKSAEWTKLQFWTLLQDSRKDDAGNASPPSPDWRSLKWFLISSSSSFDALFCFECDIKDQHSWPRRAQWCHIASRHKAFDRRSPSNKGSCNLVVQTHLFQYNGFTVDEMATKYNICCPVYRNGKRQYRQSPSEGPSIAHT